MKKIIVLVISLIILIGCEDSSVQGVTNLNSLVNPVKINNYFIGDNKYWQVCWDYEDKIWEQEEGYQIDKYSAYPITDIVDGYDYDYDIYKVDEDNYEMKVSLSCTFDVYVKPNVFASYNEELTFDGGDIYFHMDIDEKDGRYILNNMKAYKQVFH